jgi:adenylate kinase
MIICITGTPRTGKTEVAKALGRRLGCRVVHLNELARRKGLFCGRDEKRGIDVVDVGRVAKAALMGVGADETVILESHYAHVMPCDVIVVLRTNPGELRRRMEKAGWFPAKIEENAEAEIMEVCRSEALETGRRVVEVDTTGKGPDETAKEIEGLL